MTLIVETGLIVPNANSFCTITELRTFATARGVELADDEVLETQAILATDWLRQPSYTGKLVEATQPLPWPRKNAVIHGELFPADEIPIELKNAQSQLVIEQKNGNLLFPTSASNQRIKREKVGPVEAEYEYGASDATGTFSQVNNWLSPIVAWSGMGLRTVRI